MLLLFSLFHLICFLKTSCFFHVISFLRTGCFVHVICFIKTGCFKCCLFWLLSILCFVVKNDLRQKIFFASSVKYNMLPQTLPFFSFFASYVSSKLVVFFHVICFLRTGCFCMSYVPSKLVDSNVWCLVDSVVKQCYHF